MLRSRTFLLHLLLDLQVVNGSHHDRAAVIFSKYAIRELGKKKKNFGRNSLSYVMRINLWFEELALLGLEYLQLILKNSMFCKKFCRYSDNYPKMNRMLSGSCALSHWFQWLHSWLRRRIKFTRLGLYLQQVRTSPGRLDCHLQKTFLNLPNHLVKTSLITI